MHLNHCHISVYTDGSCNSAHQVGGWASILLIKDKKIVLKGIRNETSHHRMELMAVLEALDFIKAEELQINPIFIYTDSQYVAGLIPRKEQLQRNGFLNKQGAFIRNSDLVHHFIDGLADFKNIEIIKIPSHGKKQIEPNYNREVDMLSRKEVRNCIYCVNQSE